MCRVFLTGAYKKPREFNWVIGVVLLLVTLFLSFTGYLLPWDQLAFWAITVGTSIAGYAPLIGKQMQFVLLGDTTVGQEALLRFYVLHVAVLPSVLVLLIAIHFWRIRKDGGLSRPEAAQAARSRCRRSMVLETPRRRVYGLQGFVRGPFTKVGNVPDDSVYSWPNLLMAELFVFVLTVSLILVVSLLFNAPLEQPVNVMHPPNPAKAPWYFLGLQEMVSYSAFWGGIGIPRPDGGAALPGPLHRPRHQRRRQMVRPRAPARQHHLSLDGDPQRDLHRDRNLLPRAELDVRVPLLRTDRMRLALAIASFVVLIVHGVVFYDQFFHKWEHHQTAYFEQARSSKNEQEGELEARSPAHPADHRHQFRRHPRGPLHHLPHGGRRPALRGTLRAAQDVIPTRPRWAMSSATAAGSAGTSSPTSAAPSATTDRAAASKPSTATARTSSGRSLCSATSPRPTGARTSPRTSRARSTWRPTARSATRPRTSRARLSSTAGRKLFYSMNCYGCHKIDGMSEGTLGPDLTEAGKKFKVDYLWESIVEPRANLATSFMPKFQLSDADVKALVIFLKSRRGVNFAETSLDRYKAHIENVA